MRAFPFMLLWFAWLAYWYIVAGDAKADARAESPLSRLSHELPMVGGMVVMGLTARRDGLLRSLHFLPQGIGMYRSPYAHVRHPIYSGLLLAFLGALVARGDLGALLACALGTLALVMKLRREEWMREAFGETYTEYGADVPALFPRASRPIRGSNRSG